MSLVSGKSKDMKSSSAFQGRRRKANSYNEIEMDPEASNMTLRTEEEKVDAVDVVQRC